VCHLGKTGVDRRNPETRGSRISFGRLLTNFGNLTQFLVSFLADLGGFARVSNQRHEQQCGEKEDRHHPQHV
jgi:hypothetical protein